MNVEERRITDNVGNLKDEIKELKKLIPNDGEQIVYASQTRNCSAFLTIYCC